MRRILLGMAILTCGIARAAGAWTSTVALTIPLVPLAAPGGIHIWGDKYFDNSRYSAGTSVAIAAGGSHSLALKSDGSIVGWGDNTLGQASPPTRTDFVAIAAGYAHSLALTSHGSIVVWGRNDDGRATPPEGTGFVAIAAGGSHSLALKSNGSIVGWGSNGHGQASPPTGTDFVAIAAGGDHSLALKRDGSIVGWGADGHGQASPPEGTGFVAIAAGYWHSLALRSDGSIVGWGDDSCGQASPPAGTGSITVAAGVSHSLALRRDGSIAGWGYDFDGQASPPEETGFVAIAAGSDHSLALRSDGSIVGWGEDARGQTNPPSGTDFIAIACGTYHIMGMTGYHNLILKRDGSLATQGDLSLDEMSPPAGTDFVAIAAGAEHSLALKSDGTIVGWGLDALGQASPPEGTDFVAIAAGGWHSLALRRNGSIVGWGSNGSGQASPPEGTDFVAIAAGGGHSLALKRDGSIVGWGADGYDEASPPTGTDFVAIAAGYAHSLALKRDGSIVGWGMDGANQTSPPTGTDFVAIAAGYTHSLALKRDGSIAGWGDDYYGQASPPAGKGFVAIAAGEYHSLAIRVLGDCTGTVTSTLPLAGFSLYGCTQPSMRDLAGLPASTSSSARHVLGHFASGARWFTGVAVGNANDAEVQVGLTAYNSLGAVQGIENVAIAAHGNVSKKVSNLFNGEASGTGWIEVFSDADVVAFELCGDEVSGGIAALPACELGMRLALPHVLHSARWWTGISVVNPNENPVNVTLTAYGNDGSILDQQTFTPGARGRKSGMVEALLPSSANRTAWLLVESEGGPVAAVSVSGDRAAAPNVLAGLIGQAGSTALHFSEFQSSPSWWTGIAVVNPSRSDFGALTLVAYRPDGTEIDRKDVALGPLQKISGLVSDLLNLAGDETGWVEVTSDVPVVGCEFLSGDDVENGSFGLAGIESQPAGTELYFPHSKWVGGWSTLFALANPNAGATTADGLAYLGERVSPACVSIPGKGRIEERVEDLFGF